ncbi:MAG: hypothetical protein DHS20C16_13740 [Phycisphaerae bacterium]|nr:MAG: hypothetical protein DHS20C16_13740 [Phycisphaerae bacterium]
MKTFAKFLAMGCVAAAFVLVGCKKEEKAAPEVPPVAPLAKTKPTQPVQKSQKAPPLVPGQSNELPPGHPPIDGGMPKAKAGNKKIEKAVEGSAGLKLTAPEGWQATEPPAASNSGFRVAGPLAVFTLEKVEGDKEDGIVRLTHFPGMRNIPVQAQLNRWFDQVSQPDGSSTKDKAKVDTWEKDGVKISVADMTGTMMPGSGTVRMIAAVIEHPNGPHFVKAIGPVDTIEHWRESIMEYLKSSKIAE